MHDNGHQKIEYYQPRISPRDGRREFRESYFMPTFRIECYASWTVILQSIFSKVFNACNYFLVDPLSVRVELISRPSVLCQSRES